MSFDKDQFNTIARRFAAFLILLGLIIGVGLPLVVHNLGGLVVGPLMMLTGMVILVTTWWRRPRWENRDSKR